MRPLLDPKWSVTAVLVGGLTGGLLAACGTGIGLQRTSNPWPKICGDTKAYLSAVAANDQSAVSDGVRALQADIDLVDSESTRVWLRQVADAAAAGNPDLARQNYRANCAQLKSYT